MEISEGCPFPLGPSVIATKRKSSGKEYQSVNLAVLSNVPAISLCLFAALGRDERNYIRDIWKHLPFQGKTGNVHHIRLDRLPRGTAYAICVPRSDGGHRLLTDVFAPCVESYGAAHWMEIPGEAFCSSAGSSDDTQFPKNRVLKFLASFETITALGVQNVFRPARFEVESHAFAWHGHDKSPVVSDDDLIIYEAHARALGEGGSLESAAERAEYLGWLGVTAVQLMPIFEFAEAETGAVGGEEGMLDTYCGTNQSRAEVQRRRGNCWGYSPLSFFAPMNRYGNADIAGGPQALKTFVRSMHAEGILVFLDVVYNHTSNASCALHFLGVQREYYLDHNANATTHNGNGDTRRPASQASKAFAHCNFSGCGNTVSANTAHAQELIIQSLRHFVTEYHVDGFRIDAAGVLCRGLDGVPMKNPPILQRIAEDGVLRGVRFIVEGWDAGDQAGSPNFLVGSFPHGAVFREWNPVWRDAVRSFFKTQVSPASKSRTGCTGDAVRTQFRRALTGFPNMYATAGRVAPVNFISCHDGLSLADVVSYARRVNTDGYDEVSFNCGLEGSSDVNDDDVYRDRDRDRESRFAWQRIRVRDTRCRTLRNLVLTLALSRGVPMLGQGDEIAFSKHGNSNAYNDPDYFAARLPPDPQFCTDMDAFVQFVHFMFTLRKACPKPSIAPDARSDVTWVNQFGAPAEPHSGLKKKSSNGAVPRMPRRASSSQMSAEGAVVAFVRPSMKTVADEMFDPSGSVVHILFVSLNNAHRDIEINIPKLPRDVVWTFRVDTYGSTWKQDTREKWESGARVILRSQSAVVFTGKLDG